MSRKDFKIESIINISRAGHKRRENAGSRINRRGTIGVRGYRDYRAQQETGGRNVTARDAN